MEREISMIVRSAALFAGALIALTGCGAMTNIDGYYSDPIYSDARFSSVLVWTQDTTRTSAIALETSICEQLEDSGIECVGYYTLFPPTRSADVDEAVDRIIEEGFDSVLHIAVLSDSSGSVYLGSQTTGPAYSIGNTTQGTAFSTPIVSNTRNLYFEAGLRVVEDGELAWIAEGRTRGEGSMNTSDDAMLRSLSRRIASDTLGLPYFKTD